MDREPGRFPPWGVIDGVIVLAVTYIFTNLILFSTSFILRNWPPGWRLFFLELVQVSVALLGMTALLRKKYQVGYSSLGLNPHLILKGLNLGIRWGLLITLMVSALSVLAQIVLPRTPPPQVFMQVVELAESWKELLAVLIVAVVFAPVSEELVFRGLVYPALRKKLGVAPAVILNAVIFAGLHWDPYRFIPLAAGGAGLTILYQKSGSLYSSIFAHSLWNALMIGLLLIGRGLMG